MDFGTRSGVQVTNAWKGERGSDPGNVSRRGGFWGACWSLSRNVDGKGGFGRGSVWKRKQPTYLLMFNK